MTAEAIPTNYRLRWIQSGLFLALWMTLGWTLQLGPNAYLLLGVPLVIAFQLLVRRERLVTLWVRRAPRFQLNRTGGMFALLFAATPTWMLYRGGLHAPLMSQLWLLAAIGGAVGAGFALQNFNRQDGRALAYGLGTAGVIGSGFMLLSALTHGGTHPGGANFAFGLRSFLLYVPVGFVLEEVAFRGLLDSHLHHPGDPQPGWSAVLLSCAWGLWHLPIMPLEGRSLTGVLAGVLLVQGLVGLFLSNTWRSSGNLLTVAVIHALIDAVRNGLFHP